MLGDDALHVNEPQRKYNFQQDALSNDSNSSGWTDAASVNGGVTVSHLAADKNVPL